MIMKTHYRGKKKVKNSDHIHTKVCCFNSLSNEQQNFTNYNKKSLKVALQILGQKFYKTTKKSSI